jgi:uncharacterized protein
VRAVDDDLAITIQEETLRREPVPQNDPAVPERAHVAECALVGSAGLDVIDLRYNGCKMSLKIKVPKEEIAAFCRRNHIRRLAVFGSVLRDDFAPESDVDVLVEFEKGHVPGLAFITMQDELSEVLQRNVDLNTPACLSPYFRQRVLNEAEVLYVAA